MKIKIYPLYDHAVALQPAPPERGWGRANARHAANQPGLNAGGQGWDLLCPFAFTATWNGGPRPEDIEIRLEGASADSAPDIPVFVQNSLGKDQRTCVVNRVRIT